MIRLGEINYLNVYPIYHFLKKEMNKGESLKFLQLINGTPAFLNSCLKNGSVDISPSSSFYYIKNYGSSLLFPDLSISSKDKVKSIYLFSPKPLSEFIKNEEILITPETYSSVNLLKIILAEKYRLRLGMLKFTELPSSKNFEFDSDNVEIAGKIFLHIGDNALKFKKFIPKNYYAYDLAELWYEFTGYPFIFALFIIRKDSYKKNIEEFNALYKSILRSKEKAVVGFEEVAEEVIKNSKYNFITYDELLDYWRNCLSFDLDKIKIEGFKFYLELLLKNNLIDSIPAINFI